MKGARRTEIADRYDEAKPRISARAAERRRNEELREPRTCGHGEPGAHPIRGDVGVPVSVVAVSSAVSVTVSSPSSLS
jgi:hypothetical protein